MKGRLIILTEIIAPYRIPVFNALAARSEVDLHVIFLAETDPGLQMQLRFPRSCYAISATPSRQVR